MLTTAPKTAFLYSLCGKMKTQNLSVLLKVRLMHGPLTTACFTVPCNLENRKESTEKQKESLDQWRPNGVKQWDGLEIRDIPRIDSTQNCSYCYWRLGREKGGDAWVSSFSPWKVLELFKDIGK